MELHERLSHSGSVGPLASESHDPFAEVKNRIHLSLVGELGPSLVELADSGDVREQVQQEIRDRLQQEPGLARSDRERLAAEIADDIFGYGPLERLIADTSISEIMVNGTQEIWVERDGRLSQTAYKFSDDSQLRRIITKMSVRSVVGSTSRRRWSTRDCPTGRASTRSSRRSHCRARC
jgi:pilus assembly protein CpaF